MDVEIGHNKTTGSTSQVTFGLCVNVWTVRDSEWESHLKRMKARFLYSPPTICV